MSLMKFGFSRKKRLSDCVEYESETESEPTKVRRRVSAAEKAVDSEAGKCIPEKSPTGQKLQ
jgi:hypothetical protein